MEAAVQEEPMSDTPPELRQDVTTGEWVIMAPQRAQRPFQYSQTVLPLSTETTTASCLFCPGQEHQTPSPVLVAPSSDTAQSWEVRVFPNKYPAVLPTSPLPPTTASVMFPVRSAVGHHEVVVETSQHHAVLETLEPAHLTLLLHAWRERFRTLASMPRVRYILIFKNHGQRAGASLAHPHSQILTAPTVPLAVQGRYERARAYASEHRGCLLCTLLEAERGARQRLVFESDEYLVWQPYAASFPYETWIVPRLHQASFASLSEHAFTGLGQALQHALCRLNIVLHTPAYNLLVRSALNEAAEPAYHWHIQLIPRLSSLAGFELATGMAINTVLPEEAAARLREAQIGKPSA